MLRRSRSAFGPVALQHALDTDDAVGKSNETIPHLRESFDVPGQNEDTYWVQNIRPVLKKYGEYSKGRHGYILNDLSASADTLRSWFRDLADRGGLSKTIDGDRIHLHMGRRFWYARYSSTVEDFFEPAENTAADQGSQSVSTILENYRNEGKLREQRCRFMGERLADAFGTSHGEIKD